MVWCICSCIRKGSINSSTTTSTKNIGLSVNDGTNPVEGAIVTLTNITDGKTYTCNGTGSAGGCTISNVPYGVYSYGATCTGYENFESTGNYTVGDDSTTLTITMTKT